MKTLQQKLIEEESFEFLTGRLHKQGYTLEEIPELLQEYKRYLILRTLQPGELPMYSLPVDDVWHAHVLYTEQYRMFCEKVFGRYLDHRPYTKKEFEERIPEYHHTTLHRYKEVFGVDAPACWLKVT